MLTAIAAAGLALWSATHVRIAATFIVASLVIELALQVHHIWVGQFLGLCVFPAERTSDSRIILAPHAANHRRAGACDGAQRRTQG